MSLYSKFGIICRKNSSELKGLGFIILGTTIGFTVGSNIGSTFILETYNTIFKPSFNIEVRKYDSYIELKYNIKNCSFLITDENYSYLLEKGYKFKKSRPNLIKIYKNNISIDEFILACKIEYILF